MTTGRINQVTIFDAAREEKRTSIHSNGGPDGRISCKEGVTKHPVSSASPRKAQTVEAIQLPPLSFPEHGPPQIRLARLAAATNCDIYAPRGGYPTPVTLRGTVTDPGLPPSV